PPDPLPHCSSCSWTLPLSLRGPGDIRQIRFSFACSRRQTTRPQSEAPKDVPDHTSCRALSRHSLTDLFAGAPHPYYRTSAPFSFSVGDRKIMNHFVVNRKTCSISRGSGA